jgi:hypothetical protein
MSSAVSGLGLDGGSDEMRPGGALEGRRGRSDDAGRSDPAGGDDDIRPGGDDDMRGGGGSDGGLSADRDASFTRAIATLPVDDAVARRRPVSLIGAAATGGAASTPWSR